MDVLVEVLETPTRLVVDDVEGGCVVTAVELEELVVLEAADKKKPQKTCQLY